MSVYRVYLNGGRTNMTPFLRIILICTIFINVNCQKEEDFICPEGTQGAGNFADPATCRRFYQCVDGFPYLNRCPSGLYFDDISKLCTFKTEARCGPIPTRTRVETCREVGWQGCQSYNWCPAPLSTVAPSTDAPLDLATLCDPAECNLPYCFCSKDGTRIPGGLDPEDTPQMIILTFDGAVNLNNFDLYKKVLNGKLRNPNGCPIRGTFFLSHEYSNYVMVQSLAYDGHEIATGTISQQQGLQDKGYEEWAGEIIGMREILSKFANISRSEVVGTRAPFLKPGRNTQFKVLEDFGYIYDSSVGVPPQKVPVWPYTLDYKIPHECKSGTCPTKSFPGLWEMPFNAHFVESYEGGHCPYLDQCVLHNHDSDDVLEWLQEDFSRHYEQNRAPYMMPFHTNWFGIKALEQGLHKFLQWAANLDDVWFVTVAQSLTWMTDPRSVKSLNNYEPWRCDKKETAKPCELSNKCALPFKLPEANFSDTRYMETCVECPKQYPWLGDAGGTGIPGTDNYIPESLRRK